MNNFTLLARTQPGPEYTRYIVQASREPQNLPDEEPSEGTNRTHRRQDALTSIVRELEILKEDVKIQHNISISSAIIARPDWMGNEASHLVDEAVLAAGIESWEQSKDRAEMTILTAAPDIHGQALVIQHSLHHFSIDEMPLNGDPGPRGSVNAFQFYTLTGITILLSLANQVLRNVPVKDERHEKATDEFTSPVRNIAPLLHQISIARWHLEHDFQNEKNISFTDRTVPIDLSELLNGESLWGNLTGHDVENANKEFVDLFVEEIETFLTYSEDHIIWDYVMGIVLSVFCFIRLEHGKH